MLPGEKMKYKYLDMVTALFATVLITSNIASSAKIVDLGFSIFGIHLAFDGGTLLFPLSYILGDILTEVYGYRTARRAKAAFRCRRIARGKSRRYNTPGHAPAPNQWIGFRAAACPPNG